jgi:hypothetical protein
MTSVLIAIVLKSLLLAGATLGLLALMKHRSAAERSWVAHIGLLALVIMAFAPLALPRWHVDTPALLSPAPAAQPTVQASPRLATAKTQIAAPTTELTPSTSASDSDVTISPAAAASAIYAVPAAILLLLTLLALGRLIALRARADVLVDGHWLSALARAQRRMGFKHGTALLTSNELASPISWGLMRPVILLSTRAVQASGEAEAIIAMSFGSAGRALAFAELGLAKIEEAALAILRDGDPTNARRAALAAELGKKASADTYAAFLELAPSLIAREARSLRGAPLERALDAYAKARELAAVAPRVSLDAAATVFQIGGILASVPDSVSLKR